MRDNGCTEVDIKHRGLTKALADGCKNGARYRVEIEERGDEPFVATGCRWFSRYAINVNRYGDANVGKKLVSCGRRLSQGDMRIRLRQGGYDRIEFLVDRSGRRTLAEASRKSGRFKLVLNRRHRIVNEKRIGQRAEPIVSHDLVTHLQGLGNDRAQVTDRQLPRYQADACRRTIRFELVVSRYGKVGRETRRGRCPAPIDEHGLRRLITRNGFSEIHLVSTKMNEYSVIDQKRLGSCVSPRIK